MHLFAGQRKVRNCNAPYTDEDLRSRVWIDVQGTENDSTRLYKNGDISAVIEYS